MHWTSLGLVLCAQSKFSIVDLQDEEEGGIVLLMVGPVFVLDCQTCL